MNLEKEKNMFYKTFYPSPTGTIVTPIVGYFVYKQKITKTGIFALVLIILSIITLNLFG